MKNRDVIKKLLRYVIPRFVRLNFKWFEVLNINLIRLIYLCFDRSKQFFDYRQKRTKTLEIYIIIHFIPTNKIEERGS
jgi:hypothetical protein